MENRTLTITGAAQVFARDLNAFAVRVLEPLLVEDEACVIPAWGKVIKDNLKEGNS